MATQYCVPAVTGMGGIAIMFQAPAVKTELLPWPKRAPGFQPEEV
jgi:hypothetical protein